MNYKRPPCPLCYKLMWWNKDVQCYEDGSIKRVRESWKCSLCDKWLSEMPVIPKRKPLQKSVKIKILSDHPFCSKCNGAGNLSIDHIHPVAFGGIDTSANLQVLCRSCNASKSYSMAR